MIKSTRKVSLFIIKNALTIIKFIIRYIFIVYTLCVISINTLFYELS